jgi:hypothetical protein
MYKIGNKIISLNNKFPQKIVRNLPFQVSGAYFPKSWDDTSDDDANGIDTGQRGYCKFTSIGENTLTVNYGDGNTHSEDFKLIDNEYVIGYSTSSELNNYEIERHFFTDNFTGLRTINFEFTNPERLSEVFFRFIRLKGLLPSNIFFFKNLDKYTIAFARTVDRLPEKFPKNLREIYVGFSLLNKALKIPDGLFSSNVEELYFPSSLDLSDPISSNLFRIGELKDSLKILDFTGCNIDLIPSNSISQLNILNRLTIPNNGISDFSEIINLTSLRILIISVNNISNDEWFDFSNFKNLVLFAPLSLTESLIDQIPISFKPLKSMIDFGLGGFNQVVNTVNKYNLFVDKLYILVFENAYLDPSLAPEDEDYPEQFRDVAWGESGGSAIPVGTVEAPTGFIQGSNNGNPTNQGQKIYVLVNNYGHTITTS